MAVIMKNTTFWDDIPCNMMDHYQCSARTYCLHLQGKTVSQSWKKAYRHRERKGQDRGPPTGVWKTINISQQQSNWEKGWLGQSPLSPISVLFYTHLIL
jgi:hypothetical protein